MILNVLMAVVVVTLFLSGNIGLGLVGLIGFALLAFERHKQRRPPAGAEGRGRD